MVTDSDAEIATKKVSLMGLWITRVGMLFLFFPVVIFALPRSGTDSKHTCGKSIK